jgi:hypothetical protein
MAKAMKDRKFFLGGPWDVIKSKHKALTSGNLFKPPMEPLVDKFDKARADYDKLMTDKKSIVAMLTQFVGKSNEISARGKAHKEELEKMTTKDQELIDKSSNEFNNLYKDPDADSDKVLAALNAMASASDDFVSTRKSLWDRLSKLAEERVALNKKTRDEYKAKVGTFEANVKKLEAEADKLEAQIRQTVQIYAKIAVDMDHDEIESDVRSLLDKL